MQAFSQIFFGDDIMSFDNYVRNFGDPYVTSEENVKRRYKQVLLELHPNKIAQRTKKPATVEEAARFQVFMAAHSKISGWAKNNDFPQLMTSYRKRHKIPEKPIPNAAQNPSNVPENWTPTGVDGPPSQQAAFITMVRIALIVHLLNRRGQPETAGQLEKAIADARMFFTERFDLVMSFVYNSRNGPVATQEYKGLEHLDDITFGRDHTLDRRGEMLMRIARCGDIFTIRYGSL